MRRMWRTYCQRPLSVRTHDATQHTQADPECGAADEQLRYPAGVVIDQLSGNTDEQERHDDVLSILLGAQCKASAPGKRHRRSVNGV
jgi:hypothetical protein